MKNNYDLRKSSKGHDGKYPVEFPSKADENEVSPIVDVTVNEIYPYDFSNRSLHAPGVDPSQLTELIATETKADTEGLSTP